MTLIAIGALLAAGLLGLWLERRPIAASIIAHELARRGVPARYRVAEIGFREQRLVDVVIGDPRAPDLVADWIEADTRVGLSGASVMGLRAGHVRARARVVNGRLSLGSLDRLFPAPSAKPFALPALDLEVADARMRVETPAGLINVKLSGSGRLDGGFQGPLTATSERLESAGCVGDHATAALRASITDGGLTLLGPLRAVSLACGGATATGMASNLDVKLGPTFDRISGRMRVAIEAFNLSAAHLHSMGGMVNFAGRPGDLRGSVDLTAAAFDSKDARGRGLSVRGAYRIADGHLAFGLGSGEQAGLVSAREVALSPSQLRTLNRLTAATEGTPITPIAARLAVAAKAAGEHFSIEGRVSLEAGPGVPSLKISEAMLSSRTGASANWRGDAALGGFSSGGVDFKARGELVVRGGGLPDTVVSLNRPSSDSATTGTAIIRPYAADGALLAVEPVRFKVERGGAGQLSTRVTLSGPIANGRVDGLSLPVDARWGGGKLTLNPDCGEWRVARVSVSSLRLDPARLTICPAGGALLQIDGGQAAGEARVSEVRLTGSIGGSPLTLALGHAALQLGQREIVAGRAKIVIGPAERATHLDIGSLDGALANGSLVGRFGEGGGRLGTVPLQLSRASGRWSLRGGALALSGALTVSDTDAENPRFKPLPARDVTLHFENGSITAAGSLRSPDGAREVAEVTIVHSLPRGTGGAVIKVPGLVFDKTLQPDALTPVTFGVIADVAGTITGEGRISWTPEGITSSGTFRTEGTDLAAAFGPVSGLAGEIRFDDILALHSAPDQAVTVKTINPGIPVSDGTIRFQTLSGTKVRIDQGQWPFAGGQLTLEPTLLDFSSSREHAMTFALTGVDARLFLTQFDFKNLDATGTFDGVLPILFDTTGGRISGGRLAVRPAGGTISYVGDLSQKKLGFWADLAFGALKSLRYRSLALEMNGSLAGEMVTQVHFAGVTQGQGAKSNFLIRRLQRLPLVFNVRIKAPFRGLIDSAQSFYDPKRLIERNLPALIEQQRKGSPASPIQPRASEDMP